MIWRFLCFAVYTIEWGDGFRSLMPIYCIGHTWRHLMTYEASRKWPAKRRRVQKEGGR